MLIGLSAHSDARFIVGYHFDTVCVCSEWCMPHFAATPSLGMGPWYAHTIATIMLGLVFLRKFERSRGDYKCSVITGIHGHLAMASQIFPAQKYPVEASAQ